MALEDEPQAETTEVTEDPVPSAPIDEAQTASATEAIPDSTTAPAIVSKTKDTLVVPPPLTDREQMVIGLYLARRRSHAAIRKAFSTRPERVTRVNTDILESDGIRPLTKARIGTFLKEHETATFRVTIEDAKGQRSTHEGPLRTLRTDGILVLDITGSSRHNRQKSLGLQGETIVRIQRIRR